MWSSHTIWTFVYSIFSTKSFCTEHCRVVLFEPHLNFFLRVFIVKNEEYACLQLHKFTLQNLENSLDQRYELLKFESDKNKLFDCFLTLNLLIHTSFYEDYVFPVSLKKKLVKRFSRQIGHTMRSKTSWVRIGTWHLVNFKQMS